MLRADPFLWPARVNEPAVGNRPPIPATAHGSRESFGNVYARLHRDIEATVKNGFGPARRAAVSAPPALWSNVRRDRGEIGVPGGGTLRAGEAALDMLAQAGSLDARQRAFVADILPHAERAAAALGASPDLVVAHAALESGWGQRPLRHADGRTSHNVFGIKATGAWRGDVVDSTTTEYVNGAEIKTVERFRAYRDYAGAFRDYVDLIGNNRRYAGALGHGDDASKFARGLIQGGYATDPRYAAKLAQVVARLRDAPR
ncbi:Muramidase [Burkholderia dolosa AU0158]|nr:flagellar rod assembly protein/muramidase FlgJ [Burkholderia dolosa AU0158]EAY71567.1 Muramidase [Burkholderia dolosa AU0158]ETP63616.1 flagellar protein FlgJ [Burkholderia dolosa PC543]VWB96302.1 Muramidase [Burkholderia dolosa]